MKRTAIVVFALLLSVVALLSGCRKPGESAGERHALKVGATPVPHAEILRVAAPLAEREGVKIEVVEFTDYVIPNDALAHGEIEANSFQHEPYLINQIEKTGWDLVPVALTIASPMGFYSEKYKSFDEIPDGALVAIQNDPTNGARSLYLLQAHGIIKLSDDAGLDAGPADIVENPKNLEFIELDAAQLPRSLPDVDAAAVNNNYAVQAGLDPMKDAIILEDLETPYTNILAVRAEDKDEPWVQQLIDAYHSEPVAKFVNERFKGTYVPVW